MSTHLLYTSLCTIIFICFIICFREDFQICDDTHWEPPVVEPSDATLNTMEGADLFEGGELSILYTKDDAYAHSGLLIERVKSNRWAPIFTIVRINEDHAISALCTVGSYVDSINNIDIGLWTQEEMTTYLCTHRISAIECLTDKDQQKKNRETRRSEKLELFNILLDNVRRRHGFIVQKAKRKALPTVVVSEHNTHGVEVGMVVTFLNNCNILKWKNDDIAKYMNENEIEYVNCMPAQDYSRSVKNRLNASSYSSSIEAYGEQFIDDDLYEKFGILIQKKNSSRSFTVLQINSDHENVRNNHPSIEVGCIVTSVNGITKLEDYSNDSMDTFLLAENSMILEFTSKSVHTRRLTLTRRNNYENNTKRRRTQYDRERKARKWDPIRLYWNKECAFGCGCVHLSSASSSQLRLCCQNGKLHSYEQLALKQYPPEFFEIISNNIKHISRSSSAYNNIFALCATGVQNDQGGGWEKNMVGSHCVKMNGRTYHKMNNATNSTKPSGGVSYMTFDCHEAIQAHVDELNGVRAEGSGEIRRGVVYDTVRHELVDRMQDLLLQHNKYAKELRTIGNLINENKIVVVNGVSTIRGQTDYFEVAQITSQNPSGERVLTVQWKDQSKLDLITMNSCQMEPISYPLLFFYGENGWGIDPKTSSSERQVSFMSYLASRILKPEYVYSDVEGFDVFMQCRARDDDEYGNPVYRRVNRFQILSRLMQVYMVDQVSRAIDFRLRWIQKNQDTIFSGTERDLNIDHGDMDGGDEEDSDAEELFEHHSKTDYLPSSFFGSKCYLRKKAVNALTIMSELGRASFFLTLTCNTEWPEIRSQLLEGQDAYQRPDITVSVFKHRLQAFLNNLTKGKYWPDGSPKSVSYILHVIEFQHRGLPHAHIVFRINETPTDLEVSETINLVDSMISAELPEVVEGAEDEEEQIKLLELVRRFMVHKCSTLVNGCRKTVTSPCKRHYDPTNPIVPVTYIDENGWVRYRRRKETDKMIVPYNAKMILDWEGHCNLEYAASSKCLLYLYKYLYKAP